MATTALRFGRTTHTRRSEDGPLLTGRGRFTDDVSLPGQAYAAFVRAPVAHARLERVDPTGARAVPGVLAIYTGRDLAADGIGAIPPAVLFKGRDGTPMFSADMPVLVRDRIRYVGEAVALVVAESAGAAADAAERVALEYAELPAVSSVAQALAPEAAEVWPGARGNVALDWEDGDGAALDRACAAAAHVARVGLVDTRVAPSALEPRAAIGAWDAASGRYTLIASTQGVAVVRRLLAEGVFKVPHEAIRVVTHDVGGGFGMKVQAYAEYAALMYAARKLGRPVKWCASRRESFLTDTHGRDGLLNGELALDAGGRILGLRVRSDVGLGAFTSTFSAIFATANTKNCLSSVYVIPAIHIRVRMVLTNAAPLGPYRGAGRPEAIYLIERLLDKAAEGMGLDRVELRRRNLIPAGAMPYRAPNAQVYDSGEFEAVMDKALARADWTGFAARRAASAQSGRLRGIGMCCFLEVAGGILDETAELRITEDGSVELRLGVQAMGQGHLTTFPPLVARALGIDPARVRLVEGDSDGVPAGTPSVASRSVMMAGSAAVSACDEAVARGKRIASVLFEAAPQDIEYAAGMFRVVGTDRAITIFDLARRARTLDGLPGDLASGLDNRSKFVSPQMSFPNGCHVCEVEVEPETGAVEIVNYVAVDDVGNILHEPIVEGQIHGGIAQGLGQVLGEEVVYDANGQLLNASFMDYMIPRADILPALAVSHHTVPCTTNPLGAKGAGESGVAGSLPAAVNAILDALSAQGVRDLDMPMTAERVWTALRGTSR